MTRVGVYAADIRMDHSGGAKASSPQLDAVTARLRVGDTLTITRLDRLGRSVLHLITLRGEVARARDRVEGARAGNRHIVRAGDVRDAVGTRGFGVT
nr:recombinase family protein [Rhodococcus erythropolis]